ncbi:hypothetical protein HDF16_005998 [Granulicella aggregans]|uniref:Uncharacterized protein n=1 Tax=Granulicella aggregans TaxID=474949 RepID=A0A7W8E720_9BACT|nr:hypothetical protein [Granulicella aggregans]MBB5061262.1 hypothetical protein [Granulicella aggregans]
MTLEDALRWKRVLWFLSLDCWQPYSRSLWIRPEYAVAVRNAIHKAMSLGGPFPPYCSDPREWTYDILDLLRSELSERAFSFLLDWRRSIFIEGGSDRRAEFQWLWLCRSLAKPDRKIWLGPDIYEAICACRDTMIHDDALGELDAETVLILTEWDENAMKREESSKERLGDLISVMTVRNSFCDAWQITCSQKGSLFLHEIFDRTKVFLDEGDSDISLTSEELPFPSSWELEQIGLKTVKDSESL